MRGFRLLKIAGFEINIDWSWLIIFFLVIYSLGGVYFPREYRSLSRSTDWIIAVITAVLLFTSVLIHELMHSVVARRYGMEIKGITLFIFGGVSQIASEPQTAKVEFYMASAGPLTSFAISGIFYAITYVGTSTHWPLAVTATTSYIAFINLALGLFNIVPGFPLDGGRVFRSALWAWTNDLEKATRYASYVGQGFGYLLIVWGIFAMFFLGGIGGLWFVFIGWFLAGAARSSYEQVLLKEALSGVEVERVMTTDVPIIGPDITVDDFVSNYLMRHEYACYPVVEDNQIIGVVSIDEVRAVPRDKWPQTQLRDIVQPLEEEYTIHKDDDAWDALLKLANEDTKRLLVVEDKTLDGTVTQENILRLVRTKMRLGMQH